MVNDLLTNASTLQPGAPATPVETPPVSDPNPDAPDAHDEPEFEMADDGTITYADGYRIDPDGRHFDADGTEIPEGDETPPAEPVANVAATPAAAATTPAEPSAPVPQATPAAQPQAQPGQQPVYTYQNCFSPEEQTELTRLDMEDPMKAQQARFQRWNQVNAHAQDRFNTQLDALESASPAVFERYHRRIERARHQLSVEQLQTPGIVNQIIAQMVFQEAASDPKRLEDLVLGRAVTVAPAAPATLVEKPAAPVIPPAQRMPKPRGVRRPVPSRNGAGQFAGNQSGLKLIMSLNPTMSEDEAREYMQGVQSAEKRRDS